MHPKSWLAFLLLVFVTSWRAVADTQAKPGFAEELAQQRHEIAIGEGGISGPGAELLLREADRARFVLIGEDHGVAEISQVSTAIFRAARPAFSLYGAEVGPLAAEQIVSMAKDPRGMAAFDDFQRAFPFAFPFATFREDAELMALAARQGAFAGLDQEFLLAPVWLFGEIEKALRPLDAAAADEVRQVRLKEEEANRLRNAAADPEVAEIFVYSPLPAGWQRWKTLLAGEPRALRALQSLEDSHEIYSLYGQERYHDNNDVRGKLMKDQWRAAAAPFGGPALGGKRAFLRLGANHVIRGLSQLGISDIGNFLAEMAAADGAESLHVLVMPTSGALNAWVPFVPTDVRAYKIDVTSDDYRLYRDFLEAVPPGRAVYDLRPLRAKYRRLSAGKPFLEKILLGYDLVVTIDQVRPATLWPSLEAMGQQAPAAAP